MIIFAGIYEITKELNDMAYFDLRSQRWSVMYEEAQSPKKQPSPDRAGGSSPGGATNIGTVGNNNNVN